MTKPSLASDYEPGLGDLARQMCLHIATILGDLMDDIVVVGGLVPYLITDQTSVEEPHVGTRDLDLGLSLAILDGARYQNISDRLRSNEFRPGKKEGGQIIRQTWVSDRTSITIDFLIPPADETSKGGRLQDLEGDFAAIIMPALPVAFVDFISIPLAGTDLHGDKVSRVVKVCGPGAFIVMKAHAIRFRREPKDAYDLLYMLKYFDPARSGKSVESCVEKFTVIAAHPEAQEALKLLADDFDSEEHTGPGRAAEFRSIPPDPATRAEAYSYVQEFLDAVRARQTVTTDGLAGAS